MRFSTKDLLFFTALLFFIAALATACQQGEDKQETSLKEELKAAPISVQSPNEDSELALLMRHMWDDVDAMKKAIKSGEVPEDYRQKFKAIHSAEATDPDTRDAQFEAMSTAFLSSMDELYQKQQSGDKELIKNGYNLMVKACMNCHASYCPGPMVRIRKLYIPE